MYLPSCIKTILKPLFISSLLFFLINSSVFSAVLYLNPATGSIDTEEFDLVLSIDPQGATEIGNFNIYVQYNPNEVSFVSVNASAQAVLNKKLLNQSQGILNLQGYINSTLSEVTPIATIRFKTLSSGVSSTFSVLDSGEYVSSVTSSSQEELLVSPMPQSVLLLNYSNFDGSYVTESTPTQKAVPSTGYISYIPLVFGFVSILISLVLNRVYTKS